MKTSLVEECAELMRREDSPWLLESHIAPDVDAEYLDAVERGDMETAFRMVREAAARAMPRTKVVDEDGLPKVMYHATGADFNVFRMSSWRCASFFATTREGAIDGARGGVGDGTGTGTSRIIEVFIDAKWIRGINLSKSQEKIFDSLPDTFPWKDEWATMDDAFPDSPEKASVAYKTFSVVKKDGKWVAVKKNLDHDYSRLVRKNGWYCNEYGKGMDYYKGRYVNGEQLSRILAEEGGYDAYIQRDESGYSLAVWNPSQIKSAAPATYDDEGNVIPLSRRFDMENPDIRY